MGTKLMIVKVVFEYFIQYFKECEQESYHWYTEKYTKIKAFSQEESHLEILTQCEQEIQSGFELKNTDTNEDTNEEFKVDITYDLSKLISYEILAEED